MANQRIDQLNAETTPAAADALPIFSIAGSDTKKITVKNLIQVGATLIDDGSIPASKVNLGALNVVNASIDASAAIAYSKLAALTSGNIVLGDSANVATSTAVTGDVTINNTGVTAIATGVIVNADINASAGIDDTKLATIATAGKVSNSATTAASANTASAIVARDASGNFTAGTITANLTGTASAIADNIVTSAKIVDGTIVNADINASAGIDDTKLATIATAGKVSNSATTAASANTASAIVARDASGNFTAGTITANLTGTASAIADNIVTSAKIVDGTIVNADINASAGIDDTKLATIATAGKVSNSATTAASANTASAIVARDASGNFTAGTITAALTGTASGNLVSGGALGTPSSGTLTSCTGLPISTGVSGLGTGAATFLATPSSANFAALLTDETGAGAAVFATSPTLVNPALGTPSSGVLTNCTNLPVATTSVAGAVSIPAAGGFALTGGGALSHSNAVAGGASTRSGITYDLQGHIVSTVAIVASDLPAATTAAKGAVIAGTGLAVDGNGILSTAVATTNDLGGIKIGSEFGLNGSNQLLLEVQANVAGGSAYPKVTVNSKGVVTAGAGLDAGDIPNLATSQITSGTLNIDRYGANTITGAKLANYSISKISDAFPTADYISQLYFSPLEKTLYMWDGNVYQPIGVSYGQVVFSGTYDAGTNLIASVTTEGAAIGLTVGGALVSPVTATKGHYVVVDQPGTGTAPAPTIALSPPDMLLSNGTTWVLLDVSDTVTAQLASNIQVSPAGNISTTNVQSALQELDDEKLPLAGGTLTGNLALNTGIAIVYEGATTDNFETTLYVVDPTADRTILLPNVSGTVVTTGDSGTVTSTMLLDGTILNADINASAAIVDTKLATIATAGKVSNSATTAASANTASAIVARDASGNFTAGTITAALTGTASNVTTNANLTGDITSVGNATSIAAGVIVNADVNASAAIAGTKISPNFGSQTIATTGVFSHPLGAAATPSLTFTGDLNTGIFSPGADQLAVATNGTSRLSISSAGEVTTTNGNINLIKISRGAGAISSNTAVGTNALAANTTGANNTANGVNALYYNTTGSSNTANGRDALLNNTTGSSNTANGVQALLSNTTGANNTANGVNALYYNTTGSSNTANGRDALYSNTTGVNNTANGQNALEANTTGNSNTANGVNALVLNTTGSSNTANGRDALLNNTTGSSNTCYGKSAGQSLTTGSNNTIIGNITGTAGLANTVIIGAGATERLRIDSAGNVGIGTSAPGYTFQVQSGFGITTDGGTGETRLIAKDPNSSFYKFFTFYTQGANYAERMRIDDQGRVGIGTTSPLVLLQVQDGASNCLIRVISSPSSVAGIDFGDTDDNDIGGVRYDNNVDALSWRANNAERARIDSSGRLLVGTSSNYLIGSSSQWTIQTSNSAGISNLRTGNNAFPSSLTLAKSRAVSAGSFAILQNNDIIGGIDFAADDGTDYATLAALIRCEVAGTPGTNDMPGRLVFSTTADGASSPTERMRIGATGRVSFNTGGASPSDTVNGTQIHESGYIFCSVDASTAGFFNRNTSDGTLVGFRRSNVAVGTISVTTVATAYNTSSDYRLKENVTPVTDGITRLQQLKPSRFNFIADPDTVVDGFIAHEAQAVVPECVTGEKDAVDDDGNPQYQGIDQSKLVPLLTAALQEAVAKIESLEARLTAAGL